MFVKMILVVLGGILLGGILGYVGKCSSGGCPLTGNPFRGAMFGGLIGLFLALTLRGALISSTGDASITMFTNDTKQTETEEKPMQIEIDTSEFQDQVLEPPGVALVDFYADWCGPCRSLAPTIASLAEAYANRVTVAKVNVDHNSELAQQFGIQGIPAVLIFKDGEVVNRLIGLQSETEYTNALDQALAH